MTDVRPCFQPEDVFDLRTLSDVALSPDGKRVAVTVTFADREKDEYRSFIGLVDLNDATGPNCTQRDNSALAKCTQPDKKSWSPQFSPHGRALAFISDRSGAAQLWVMPLTGGEPVQRTFYRNGVSSPCWSPDGTQIAFLSAGGEREAQKDEKKEDKPPVKVLKRVRYREDGRGFFNDKPNHVFVVDAWEGDPKQLTNGDDDDRSPAWSPDGTTIAFVANRTDDPGSDVADIWIVKSQGAGQLRCLTTATQIAEAPQWSADGTKLCVLGQPKLRTPGLAAQVGFVPLMGGAVRFVTDPEALNFSSVLLGAGHAGWFQLPKWTTQGVIALGNARGRQNLYLVSEQGDAEPLTEGDQSVFSFDASADGSTIVFSAGRQGDPVNLYRQQRGQDARRLTNLNSWLEQRAATKIESFTYKSDDGTEIDAWLVQPPQHTRSEPLPLLLLIHGGPHCAYGYGWLRNAIAYASGGYRVLFVNPRGSAGYGEAFARAIHPKQGDIDQVDLLAGVDAAIARGGVDPKRLGVTGGSYGGFMTNMLLGRTSRFAAGVTLCCISNWTSYYGTADYGWMMNWEFGVQPWEDSRLYLSQSPLTYAAKINAPLLILHGEDDLRCPIEQAEQMFALLQRRGVKCEMRRYPGEPHSIGSHRPAFAADALSSALSWFDSHI